MLISVRHFQMLKTSSKSIHRTSRWNAWIQSWINWWTGSESELRLGWVENLIVLIHENQSHKLLCNINTAKYLLGSHARIELLQYQIPETSICIMYLLKMIKKHSLLIGIYVMNVYVITLTAGTHSYIPLLPWFLVYFFSRNSCSYRSAAHLTNDFSLEVFV